MTKIKNSSPHTQGWPKRKIKMTLEPSPYELIWGSFHELSLSLSLWGMTVSLHCIDHGLAQSCPDCILGAAFHVWTLGNSYHRAFQEGPLRFVSKSNQDMADPASPWEPPDSWLMKNWAIPNFRAITESRTVNSVAICALVQWSFQSTYSAWGERYVNPTGLFFSLPHL